MLARNMQRTAARSFATAAAASSASGVRVAAVEGGVGGRTGSLTVLVKAGSRYEPKEGVANALKNFAFKSTAKRTTLGTVRESDLYGGVLSSSLGREHLALSAEFLKGDEALFLDILTSFITSAKFTRHEFAEYVAPLIESDTAAASANPAVQAIELAHAIAFRQGLASSLYAPAHPNLGLKDVQDYAARVFTKDNIAVVGTGIEPARLAELVDKAFANAAASGTAAPTTTSAATKYYGGETRVAGNGQQTVFIGFGTTGAPSAEVATLAAYLNPSPSVKWSKGASTSALAAAALPEGASVEVVYLPYSDAALVGLLVQAPTAEAVREAGVKAVEALKKAAVGAEEGDVQSAVAKAKFAVASAADKRAGVVEAIGSKIFSGSDVSLASTLSAFDAVNAAGFTQATAELLKSKPTFVAVGDVVSLPYADELGL